MKYIIIIIMALAACQKVDPVIPKNQTPEQKTAAAVYDISLAIEEMQTVGNNYTIQVVTYSNSIEVGAWNFIINFDTSTIQVKAISCSVIHNVLPGEILACTYYIPFAKFNQRTVLMTLDVVVAGYGNMTFDKSNGSTEFYDQSGKAFNLQTLGCNLFGIVNNLSITRGENGKS